MPVEFTYKGQLYSAKSRMYEDGSQDLEVKLVDYPHIDVNDDVIDYAESLIPDWSNNE